MFNWKKEKKNFIKLQFSQTFFFPRDYWSFNFEKSKIIISVFCLWNWIKTTTFTVLLLRLVFLTVFLSLALLGQQKREGKRKMKGKRDKEKKTILGRRNGMHFKKRTYVTCRLLWVCQNVKLEKSLFHLRAKNHVHIHICNFLSFHNEQNALIYSSFPFYNHKCKFY